MFVYMTVLYYPIKQALSIYLKMSKTRRLTYILDLHNLQITWEKLKRSGQPALTILSENINTSQI